MSSQPVRMFLSVLAAVPLILTPLVSASAQNVKVGVLGVFSGPYSVWGDQYRNAIELYLEQIDHSVDGNTIEVVYRDVGGLDPARARQLAQELIIKEGVQYLAGGTFTPNVLAVAPILEKAEVPFVIFNSATSSVTDRSEWFTRVGFTQWTINVPVAKWATEKGQSSAVIVAADYAPGHDATAAYTYGVTQGGGKVLEVVNVPLGTADFSSYNQRIERASPDAVFMFMPIGPMSVGFIKSYLTSGLASEGVPLYTGSEMQEDILPTMGDDAIGVVSALHYGPFLESASNEAFIADWTKRYGDDVRVLPNVAGIAAYDGFSLIGHMIKATGGERAPEKAMEAARGHHWISPRGPVTIDPETREIIQNVYIREVVKGDEGILYNKAIHTFVDQKEPWHAIPPEQRK